MDSINKEEFNEFFKIQWAIAMKKGDIDTMYKLTSIHKNINKGGKLYNNNDIVKKKQPSSSSVIPEPSLKEEKVKKEEKKEDQEYIEHEGKKLYNYKYCSEFDKNAKGKYTIEHLDYDITHLTNSFNWNKPDNPISGYEKESSLKDIQTMRVKFSDHQKKFNVPNDFMKFLINYKDNMKRDTKKDGGIYADSTISNMFRKAVDMMRVFQLELKGYTSKSEKQALEASYNSNKKEVLLSTSADKKVKIMEPYQKTIDRIIKLMDNNMFSENDHLAVLLYFAIIPLRNEYSNMLFYPSKKYVGKVYDDDEDAYIEDKNFKSNTNYFIQNELTFYINDYKTIKHHGKIEYDLKELGKAEYKPFIHQDLYKLLITKLKSISHQRYLLGAQTGAGYLQLINSRLDSRNKITIFSEGGNEQGMTVNTARNFFISHMDNLLVNSNGELLEQYKKFRTYANTIMGHSDEMNGKSYTSNVSTGPVVVKELTFEFSGKTEVSVKMTDKVTVNVWYDKTKNPHITIDRFLLKNKQKLNMIQDDIAVKSKSGNEIELFTQKSMSHFGKINKGLIVFKKF